MLDAVNTILANLFRTVVIWRFMMLVFSEKTGTKWKEYLAYGGFFIGTSAVYLAFHFPPLTIAVNIISLFVITCRYKSGYKKKCIITLLVYGLGMSCDLLAVYAFSDYRFGGSFNIFAVYVSITLFCLCVTIITEVLMITKRYTFVPPYGGILILIPVLSIGLMFLFMKSNLDDRRLLVALSAGIMVINMLTFYLYYALADAYQKLQEQSLMERQLSVYENQLEVLMKSEERVRALRHDMKNHMLELGAMAKRAHNEEMESYLSGMQEFMENDMEYISSGNMEADSLLNYLLHKAEQKFCHVTYKISIPQELGISNCDLNVVMGNLLDNAIAAAEKSEEKQLSVSIRYDKEVLYIQIRNSFANDLKQFENQFLSTKQDGRQHGIGLQNVRRIVEKYGGTLAFEQEQGMFIVNAMMFPKYN